MKLLSMLSVAVVLVMGFKPVYGHSMRFGSLYITENAPEEANESTLINFDFRLSVAKAEMNNVRIELPVWCKDVGKAKIVFSKKEQRKTWQSKCAKGLTGATLKISGLSLDSQVRVTAQLPQSAETRTMLSAEKPTTVLGGNVTELQSGSDFTALANFILIGMEHIIFGFDHLLFILGLILLVSFRRRLLYVITAFTLGHGLTIVGSLSFGTTLPQLPVEILIALSLAILAREAWPENKSGPKTLLQTYPELMSVVFGVVHGFGFAGALSGLGYTSYSAVSLVGFNIGVEFGQLLFIGLLWFVYELAKRFYNRPLVDSLSHKLRYSPHYIVGVLGMFWFWDRLFSL